MPSWHREASWICSSWLEAALLRPLTPSLRLPGASEAGGPKQPFGLPVELFMKEGLAEGGITTHPIHVHLEPEKVTLFGHRALQMH